MTNDNITILMLIHISRMLNTCSQINVNFLTENAFTPSSPSFDHKFSVNRVKRTAWAPETIVIADNYHHVPLPQTPLNIRE